MPNLPHLVALAAFGLVAGCNATIALADTSKDVIMTTTAIVQPVNASIARYVPKGYREVARRSVTVDKKQAELIRYERTDGRNAALGGEHFSFVIADNGRLEGFARMDLDLVGGKLPSREEAEAIAIHFLQEAAPDLLPVLKISWIDPHGEPLQVTRNGRIESLALTGMKVKMRNTADGLWMWVIVGAGGKVMVFERDIHWITFPGHRGTEKWLHDSWLAEKGYSLSTF